LLVASGVELAMPIHQTIADALQQLLRSNRGDGQR